MNDSLRFRPLGAILWSSGDEVCMIGLHGPVVVDIRERQEILDEIDSLVSSSLPHRALERRPAWYLR